MVHKFVPHGICLCLAGGLHAHGLTAIDDSVSLVQLTGTESTRLASAIDSFSDNAEVIPLQRFGTSETLNESFPAQLDRHLDKNFRPRRHKELRKDPHDISQVDCKAEPYLCQEPFRCNVEKSQEELDRLQIATADGHPDLSSWCESPYSKAANECFKGNLTGYATVMHRTQVATSNGNGGIEGMDAHYCFSFGHCDNTEVTVNTTLQEAEDMCDRRFGHDRWSNLTFDEAMGNLAFWPEGDLHLGLDLSMHLGPKAEFAFAEMACAMGNYHCDVVYCQQEYCNAPEFVEKYGHLKFTPSQPKTEETSVAGANATEDTGVQPTTSNSTENTNVNAAF